MKKFSKIVLLTIMLVVTLANTVFAGGDRYIISKELVYESNRKTPLPAGFVEVFVGNTNFVQYQKDYEIIITPTPDEMKEDEYGNLYAYFDVSGLYPKEKFKVTIKRDLEIENFEVDIPARTDSVVNEETSQFIESSKRIDSDEPEIISKAKEITEGISTDYKKAQAIFEYVNVNMSYDTSSAYANQGALAAFENMKGVCEEFTTLFVAFCRAVDIPSRAIEGYKIEEVYESGDTSGDISGDVGVLVERNLANHVWAEIYLDGFGWLPVEPTIIYTINGERAPYFDSFCRLEKPEYIAMGIYNYEKANRRIKGVSETKFVETIVAKEDVQQEKQNTFTDLGTVEWAKADIQNLYSRGIVEGYSSSIYGPENKISRIEFICMLSRLLEYYDTQASEGGMVYYYQDYDQNHWSKDEYDYLLRCYQARNPSDRSAMGFDEIIQIFGLGNFYMNKAITRAEVVAMMDIFLDATTDSSISFSDVKRSTNFRDSIIKAASNGLINGYPDGTYRPNNPITRAEMAVILGRYISGNIYTITE